MKRFTAAAIALLLCVGLVPSASGATAKTAISFSVQSTPNAGESLVTFYGQVKPAAKAKISIENKGSFFIISSELVTHFLFLIMK